MRTELHFRPDGTRYALAIISDCESRVYGFEGDARKAAAEAGFDLSKSWHQQPYGAMGRGFRFTQEIMTP